MALWLLNDSNARGSVLFKRASSSALTWSTLIGWWMYGAHGTTSRTRAEAGLRSLVIGWARRCFPLCTSRCWYSHCKHTGSFILAHLHQVYQLTVIKTQPVKNGPVLRSRKRQLHRQRSAEEEESGYHNRHHGTGNASGIILLLRAEQAGVRKCDR